MKVQLSEGFFSDSHTRSNPEQHRAETSQDPVRHLGLEQSTPGAPRFCSENVVYNYFLN